MLDNPTVRFAIRAVLGGVAAAVSVFATGGDWRQVVTTGILSALALGGVSAATPVDRSVGVGKEV